MSRWLRAVLALSAAFLSSTIIGVALAAPSQAVSINLPDLVGDEGPSSAIVLLLSLTVLAVAPAL